MSRFGFKMHNVIVVKDNIVEHLSRHKKQYLIIGVLLFSAFIVGVIAGFGHHNLTNVSSIPDVVFKRYLNAEISIGTLFLSRILNFVGLSILIWFFSCNKWLSLVNVLILIYQAFVLGATSAILMILFKFSGVINVIIVYLPCYLISLCCFLSLLVACQKYTIDRCNYQGGILSLDFYYSIKNVLFSSIIVYVLVNLLQIVLLPIFSSALIIAGA